MFAVGSKLTNAMIVRDTRGLLDWLSHRSFATSPTGVIGYCMSGQFVVSVGGSCPDRIKHLVKAIPGTEHGFCSPERPADVHAAVEAIWETVFYLYQRTLK